MIDRVQSTYLAVFCRCIWPQITVKRLAFLSTILVPVNFNELTSRQGASGPCAVARLSVSGTKVEALRRPRLCV